MENIFWENDRKLVFHNIVEYKEQWWFWDINYNGLFCCRKNEKYAKKVLSKYKESTSQNSLYGKLILYKGKIICVPQRADCILIYTIDSGREHYIEMEEFHWDKVSSQSEKFYEYIICDKYAFFLGYKTSVILKFNMDAEKIEGYIDPYSGRLYENRVFFMAGITSGRKLFVPDDVRYVFFEIDVDTMQYTEYEIEKENEEETVVYIDKKNDAIWLMPQGLGPFTLWNREFAPDKKYFFPFRAIQNEVMIFEPETEKFTVVEWSCEKTLENIYKESGRKRDRLQESFFCTQKIGETLYVYETETKELILYMLKDGTTKNKAFYMTEKEWQRLNELQFYEIETFINFIKNESDRDRNEINSMIGMNIYNAVKTQIK